MITGSCLCGQVRYEVEGELGGFVHCHCQTCRKAHGSAISGIRTLRPGTTQISACRN